MNGNGNQISNLTNELENILTIQEMSEKLYDEQIVIQDQAETRYTEEKEEEAAINNKMSLLNRKFLYGDISLHNLHTWINILKVIFVLLAILVLYLIIFRHAK
jgi:hypothetical protein